MREFSKRHLKPSELWLFATPILVFVAFGIATWVRSKTPQSQMKRVPPKRPMAIYKPPRRTGPGHNGGILDLAWAPNGRLLLSSGGNTFFQPSDCNVMVWRLQKGSLLPGINIKGQATPSQGQNGRGLINAVAFSPDGKWFVLGGEGRMYRKTMLEGRPVAEQTEKGLIELRDTRSGKIQRSWDTYFPIQSLAIDPNGKTIATGGTFHGDSGEIKVWEAKTGKLIWTVSSDWRERDASVQSTGGVQSVAFSPDGKTIATISSGVYGLRLWDAKTGKLKYPPKEIRKDELPFLTNRDDHYVLAYSNDGRCIAVNYLDTQSPPVQNVRVKSQPGVTIYNANTMQIRHQFACEYYVNALAFSPDGKRLLAGGGENDIISSQHGQVWLWDMGKGQLLGQWEVDDRVSSVVFAPDKKQFVVGTQKMTWGEIKFLPLPQSLLKSIAQ